MIIDEVKRKQLEEAQKELERARGGLRALERKHFAMELKQHYSLLTPEGEPVPFSTLFGDSTELIVVHNMGRSCPYCTLWADGFAGVARHLDSRAPFVLVSPDDPGELKKFSESRGWTFRKFSAKGSTFTADMGFEDENGHPQPGVSTFHKEEDGTIRRTTASFFGPGDDFCSVWHLFDLLHKGAAGWHPKYEY